VTTALRQPPRQVRDWAAQFIAADIEQDSAPLFRREFQLAAGHGAVASATLTLSALGICEAWIDGTAVSDALLTPGWTSYEWRLHHVIHDVTHLMSARPVIGVSVGNGWYRGRLGWIPTRRYGTERAAFVQLAVLFDDGYEQVVGTDESWRVGPSEILSDDLYDGQTIDARRRDPAWMHAGFDDGGWGSVHAVDPGPIRFEPDPAPPVRRVDEIRPESIHRDAAGAVILDFGVNVVGYLRVRVRGRRGTVLTARHAEVLEDGALALRTLRTAQATDRFILSGGDDVLEPAFTFHGFRYAEITGWTEDLDAIAEGVSAVVISSDLRRIGTFSCSVPDLDRLHENVVRSMRGNFIDIPTDCPQRDERLGWTGDISVFAPTAAYLYDTQAFLEDWLEDVALEQEHHDGIVPFTVPDILKHALDPRRLPGEPGTTAVWSDAVVWVPWALWEAYGDPRTLAASFDAMVVHGRHVRSSLSADGLWDEGFQFGDWLDPDAPPTDPGAAKADPAVVATACAYRSADRIRAAALVLGRTAEAEEFTTMTDDLRLSFQRAYVHPDTITSDCTTVYALAIVFGLLDEVQLVWAGSRLAELVAASGHRISTGFAGTPFIADALTSTGHAATAYRLLLQRESPSWLYPVTMGATTIWERWDSMLADGSINPGEMTSFNHYALGAVADWMHRVVAGIAPLEPGYRRILFAPVPGEGVDRAQASLETPRGHAAISWVRLAGEVEVRMEVPAGSTAVFRWSGREDEVLVPGAHVIRVPCREGVPAE
jgi:alpha-L-rhamnosidase